jgi:single-stranded-DNA-specific exonuclease
MGLAGYHTINNIGLKALLRVAGLKDGEIPSAGQVGFRIAPRINASGRMADAQSVIELFLTTDAARAEELAALLNLRNEERQEAERLILKQVLDLCEEQKLADQHSALVFAGKGWHRGVVGIVASRIVEKYHRPTFVLGVEEEFAQGSGRSIRAFDLHAALESMNDLFTKFGGHKFAAGLTMPPDRVEEFRARLDQYAAQTLSAEDRFPLIEIDAEIQLQELNDRSVERLLSLAPFGHGNPTPMLLVRDCLVEQDPIVFKEKHLRLTLKQGARTIVAKAWDRGDDAVHLPKGTRVDVVIQVEEDTFSRDRGYQPWSVTMRDLRFSATFA